MTKYKNRKTVVNGIEFDSKKEAKRYSELLLLEKAGAISNLQMQVKYILIPKQYSKTEFTKAKKPKLLERECCYLADFAYIDTKAEELVVEDTKGMRTKDYIIKRKLMLYVHGIKIKEI